MQEGSVFYPPEHEHEDEDESVPDIIDEMKFSNLHVNDVNADYIEADSVEFIDNEHSHQQHTFESTSLGDEKTI